MNVRRVVPLLCLLSFASAATAQDLRVRPFEPPAFEALVVPDEFIVVFRREAQAGMVVRRDARGGIAVNRPEVTRALERAGAIGFRRQFAYAPPRPAGSRFPDLGGHYSVKLAPGRALEAAIAEFERLPGVDHVERIGLHPIQLTPNDTYYDDPPVSFPYAQWHYWNDHSVDADLAWDLEAGDPSVVVGVLDSGVKYRHTDLGGANPAGPSDPITQGNMWVNVGEVEGNGLDDDGNGFVDDVIGWDFVDAAGGAGVTCLDNDCGAVDNDPNDGEGHGTHVSGTVAAITNNARGVAGVAGGYSDGTLTGAGNGVRVMPLRIGYRARYQGVTTGIVRMDWAAQAMNYVSAMVDLGVNVASINCSWGSSNSGGLDAAVDDLLAHDVVIVASAGNSGSSTASFLGSKAGVVAVAATDSLGAPASFSNHGAWVEIAAPGVDIMSTFHDPTDPDSANMYVGLSSGTSMSSPHVAAVAGLLESYNPALTGPQKIALMESTAQPYSGGLDLGAGIVNARLALEAAAPACAIAADFSGNVTTGCAGQSVDFTDLSTGSPTGWSWDFGDGGSSNAQHPSHVYAAPGTYAVTLVASAGAGCEDTETKTAYVTIGETPVADFSASLVSGPAPLQVDFTDLSSGAPTSWSWDFGDGDGATTQDATHTYTAEGTYTVTLTSTNDCGSDPEEKTALITVIGPVGVPVGAGGAGALTLGTLRHPSRGGVSLRVGMPEGERVTLRIVDAGGRVVREFTLAGGAGERRLDWDGRDRDGQALPAGLYMVVARAGAAEAATKVVLFP